jgi:hypothetical protein
MASGFTIDQLTSLTTLHRPMTYKSSVVGRSLSKLHSPPRFLSPFWLGLQTRDRIKSGV